MSIQHFRYAVKRPFRLGGVMFSPHDADPERRLLPEALPRLVVDNLILAGDVEMVMPVAAPAPAPAAAEGQPPAPSQAPVRRVPPPSKEE